MRRSGHLVAERLIELLPELLHVDAWAEDEDLCIQSTLRLISREAKAVRPGGETLITRLADVLVVQALRLWLNSAAEAERGWLGALRDEKIGHVLAIMHREPGRPWSVASLAKEAGMSRSAFCATFTELVGESAIHYPTRWRMHSARVALRETAEPLMSVSKRYGYRSETAFYRAFRRTFGVSPRRFRRAGG